MKYVFDYEETLSRRVTVDALDLADALQQLHKAIDDCTLVLNADDFLAAAVRMPIKDNPYIVRIENCGEVVENSKDFDIVLEEW